MVGKEVGSAAPASSSGDTSRRMSTTSEPPAGTVTEGTKGNSRTPGDATVLLTDMAKVAGFAEKFAAGAELGPITAVERAASDRHAGGRVVYRVAFASGLELAAKPSASRTVGCSITATGSRRSATRRLMTCSCW